MKVLVTGGAGYIGANLVKSLLTDKHISEIVIYDSFCRKNFNALAMMHDRNAHKLKVVNGDILDTSSLRERLIEADCIVHCAAVSRAAFNEDNPHLFDQVNHWGTANLVRELSTLASVKKKLVFLSSGSVYGLTDKPAKEGNEPHPVTSYASSKFNAEKHLAIIKDIHDVITLRLGNVFGFGIATRFDSVINQFFLNAIFDKPLYVEGSGEQVRPFIFIEDVVIAIHNAITSKHFEMLLNVSNYNWSINEVVTGLMSVFPDVEVIHVNRSEKLKDLQLDSSLYGNLFRGEHGQSDIKGYIEKMKHYFGGAEADL